MEAQMPRKLVALAAAAVGAVAFLPGASATTAPVLTLKVQVTVSDVGVKLSTTQSYRGWNANFIVRNVGKKPHKFVIGPLSTPVLKPGGRAVVKAELVLRGRVAYHDPLNPSPRSRGYFKVI
jgi:hypothetical protein